MSFKKPSIKQLHQPEKHSSLKVFPIFSGRKLLSLHETDEEVSAFTDNFPGWDVIGTIPFKEIRELNIPSVNIGVYGKDV